MDAATSTPLDAAQEMKPSVAAVDPHVLDLASAYVRAAMKGRKVLFKTDTSSLRWMQLYYSRWYRNLITCFALLHMALVLLEPPSGMNPASLTPSLTLDTRPIEAAILCVYVGDIVIKWRFMGVRPYFAAWNKVEFACTLAFALDLAIPSVSRPGYGVQFTRILRPFFIVTRRKHLRFIFNGIAQSVPQMLPSLLLLVLSVLVSASLATLFLSQHTPAFHSLPTNSTSAPPYCSVFSRGACQDYFSDFGSSTYQMFVLMARANWPLVALPVYARSEWTALFFMAFMLVSHFFFWRLLLAVSFTSFAEHCREQYVAQQRRSRAAFRAAFALLQVGGYMERAVFLALATRAKPSQPSEVVEIIFHAVGGHVGYIDAQGFVAACTLLDVRARRLRPLSLSASPLNAWAYIRRRLLEAVAGDTYTLGLDALIVIVTVIELSVLAHTSTSAEAENVTFITTSCIAGALAVEAVVKMLALGVRRYFYIRFNRLDVAVLAVTLLALLVTTLLHTPSSIRTPLFVLLRAARLLRLLSLIPSVRVAMATVRTISPLLSRIVIVLFITMYCLAIVGMEAFSGIMPPSDSVVAASAYGLNGQYALNFDTFTRAFMSQFAILVTTQSPLIAEGLMAGTRSWWPVWYYALCYTVIVCIVSNILIALLLQSYGISASRTAHRENAFVEVWEHLMLRAQFDLHALNPWQYKSRIGWQFQRRNAFLTVNETLFGEALALDFEVDATEARLAAEGATGLGTRKSRASRSADGAWKAAARATETFFGNFLVGMSTSRAEEASAVRGFTSLRVHSSFDPVAFMVALRGREAAVAEAEDGDAAISNPSRTGGSPPAPPPRLGVAAGAAEGGSSAVPPFLSPVAGGAPGASMRTQRRGLTEFIHSALVPADDAWLFVELFGTMEAVSAGPVATNAAVAAHVAIDEASAPLTRDLRRAPTYAADLHATRAMRPSATVSQIHGTQALTSSPASTAGAVQDTGRQQRLRRMTQLAAALAAEHAALRKHEVELAVRESRASAGSTGRNSGRGWSSVRARLQSIAADDQLAEEDVVGVTPFDGTGLSPDAVLNTRSRARTSDHSIADSTAQRLSVAGDALPPPPPPPRHRGSIAGIFRALTSSMGAMRHALTRAHNHASEEEEGDAVHAAVAVAGHRASAAATAAADGFTGAGDAAQVDRGSFSLQAPLLQEVGGSLNGGDDVPPSRMLRRRATMLGADVHLPDDLRIHAGPSRRGTLMRAATVVVQDGFTFLHEGADSESDDDDGGDVARHGGVR